MIGDSRHVTVCCVPFEMTIVDGGILFSDKSGFYGLAHRYMFEHRNFLWYLVEDVGTFDKTALCHLVSMSKLLHTHIGGDHEEFNVTEFRTPGTD